MHVPQILTNRAIDSWPLAQRLTARSSKRQCAPRPRRRRYPQAEPPQRGSEASSSSAPARKLPTQANRPRRAQVVPPAAPQSPPFDQSPRPSPLPSTQGCVKKRLVDTRAWRSLMSDSRSAIRTVEAAECQLGPGTRRGAAGSGVIQPGVRPVVELLSNVGLGLNTPVCGEP